MRFQRVLYSREIYLLRLLSVNLKLFHEVAAAKSGLFGVGGFSDDADDGLGVGSAQMDPKVRSIDSNAITFGNRSALVLPGVFDGI